MSIDPISGSLVLKGKHQKKMTIEAYTRNLRGVNDGGDFEPEYLVSSVLVLVGVY